MFPPFTTSRLILRPLALTDASRLERIINDYDIACMLIRVLHPYPPGAAEDFIKQIRPGQEVFAVCLQDGPLIGCIAFQPEEHNMQFGYWLGKAFWGKGYMSEAAGALLNYIFSETDMDNIETCVFSDNPASWQIQEKLGFRRTGEIMQFSLGRQCEVQAWTTKVTRDDFLKQQK